MRRPDNVSLKDRNDNFVKLLASVQNDLCKEAFENIIDTKHKHNNTITGLGPGDAPLPNAGCREVKVEDLEACLHERNSSSSRVLFSV